MTKYLGKLTKEDKEFFNERKGGKTIHKSERTKPEKKQNPERNLPIRGQ